MTGDDLHGVPHIVLLGGQMLPNLIPALELGVKGVFTVSSSDQSSRADAHRVFKTFGIEPLGDIEVHPYYYRSVIDTLMDMAPKLAALSPRWVLNATGGTKPMSFGAIAGLSKRVETTIYYDNRAHEGAPGIVIDGASRQVMPMTRKLTVRELLLAHGLPERPKGDAPYPIHGTDHLYFHMDRETHSRDAFVDGRSAAREGTALPLLRRYARLSGAERREVGGYLLEGIVFGYLELLAEQDHVGGDMFAGSVGLSKYKGGYHAWNHETELDILLSDGARLLYLSCKATEQKWIIDEIVDVETRRRQVGGVFGGAMLAHHLPADDNVLRKKDARNRAKRFGITLIGREELSSLEAFHHVIRNHITV